MLFHEPEEIKIEKFPPLYFSRSEVFLEESLLPQPEVPMVPEEFYRTKPADDELAKQILKIASFAIPVQKQFVQDKQRNISVLLNEVTEVLGGVTAILYLHVDEGTRLVQYDAQDKIYHLTQQLFRQLSCGEDVCLSAKDATTPETLSSCASFLAMPLCDKKFPAVLFLGFDVDIQEDVAQIKQILEPYLKKLLDVFSVE